MNWIIILEKTREEITKSIGTSAAFGSITDGAVAASERRGPGHVIKEMVGGALTGASGAIAKEAYEHFTKSSGPVGLVVGVGASIGTRYLYRRITDGDTGAGEDGRTDQDPSDR